jgi:hypothetical protein
MAEVLACTLRDHDMSRILQCQQVSCDRLVLSHCLSGDLVPSLAYIPQLSDSLYPFTAQLLLVFVSTVILSFGNRRTHDHIFLFHDSKLRILPTQYINVFHMVLPMNSDYFPKQ